MNNDYGEVLFDKQKYTLIEEAHLDEDQFKAAAIDEYGNEFEITWDVSGENEWGNATYDFDNPKSVQKTEETPVKPGETYEDPEGEWEIIAVDGREVTVKQIQKGNINYGLEACVDAAEAWYFLTHDYPWSTP